MRSQRSIISGKKNFTYYSERSCCYKKTFSRKIRKKKKVEEILTKEYQYKNSYQGKYCNPGNMYGPWYLESTINSYTKHLFAFDLFDKKNNYERIRF